MIDNKIVNTDKINEFVGDIISKSKHEKNFGTGLLGEALLISTFRKMGVSELEKVRFVLNKIIKTKKEYTRVNSKKVSANANSI